MLELGILKTWNTETYKAGVQLAGSLTTYLDDIAVATNIAPEAMTVGNYVLVAIPGGNPRDACVVASWPAGSSGGGGGDKIQDADGDTYLWVEKTADEDKIHGVVKGVEAFLLDDAGILTLAKQSSARMDKGNNTQTIYNQTWTKVTYNIEVWDIQGDEVDLANNKITVKVAGIYLLIAQTCIYSMPDTSELIAAIRVNGADIGSGRIEAPTIVHLMALATTVYQLSANDYVEGFAYQKSGATRSLGQYTGQNYLIVHKIA